MRPLLLALLPLALLTGCPNPVDTGKDVDSGTDDVRGDNDGDRYPVSEGDCDDKNPEVNPGAAEACDGIDNNCDGEIDEGVQSTFYRDDDQDGFGDGTPLSACEAPDDYTTVSGDCDDTDHSVFPEAPEVCNRVDDDCDGSIDEDVGEVRWVDGDGDGYGDPLTEQVACADELGLVDNPDDCDDTDNATNPAADEVCDEADNDCDGVVDDGVTTTWFADVDEDGYGDATLPVAACAQPTGYAATGDDCADADATIHPDAPETCDGVDQDCDGVADDGATDMAAWYADNDGDGHGAGTATVSCSPPAGYVGSADDCDDTNAAAAPGLAERCNGVDDDCDGSVDEASATDAATWYGDADGDGFGAASFVAVSCDAPVGYVATADDCDDLDANVYPGAPETCDGVDEDCDGAVDDGAVDPSDWYADADGDTYGDAATGVSACEAPAMYVADATDCDDAAAGTHPGARETCDGVDEDCDGVVDDGVTLSSWYADVDGDHYGDPAVVTSSCAAPAGTVSTGTDCDDGDAAVHPGAPEVCDGDDQDCDGVADDGLATSVYYADADLDAFGDPAVSTTRCAAPSGYVVVASDCDDTDHAIHPGAAEVCDGVDQDCDGVADDGVPTTTWYADADGDGYGDASAPFASCGTPSGYVTDDTDCDDTNPLIFPESDGTCADGFDCQDILDAGLSTGSGTYTIDPDGSGSGAAPFFVLCEMDLYGGGWTQAIQAYLDSLSTSVSRNYLYSYGTKWYVSPSTTLVWDWSSYQGLNGTYGYGSGATLTSTFGCTSWEGGSWGVGCSNGPGGTYKVLPIYTSDPAAATSTVCQDLPDNFGAGACRSGASIWVR